MENEKFKFIGGVDFDELKAQRVQVYDTITFDLAAARINEEISFVGNYLYVVEATDVNSSIDIRFNEIFRKIINFKTGRGIKTPFYRLYISNTAQVGKTITIARGIETDIFQIFDALRITGSITSDSLIQGASGTPSYGQVSITNAATLIKAVNSNRRSILVQNLDGTNDLFIAYDASITTANAGQNLKPFAAVELYFTGTIYGIRSAGTGNAAYLEESN